MANRFLSNININDEYTFPSNDGSAGQAIITDGSGNLSFGSAVASSADSTESVHIQVKNTSGSQILKGTPVYVTGETGNSGKIEIAPADASDSSKMPALGILESTLNNNSEGFCVQGGLLEGLATATIDGTSTTANDTVYIKAGGGLTMTKPTGSNLIQNIAKVARVHASNGSLVVSSILRTNDVPNLTTGKIWVGDGNTVESTVVHLDEVNERMGIGTTSPSQKLHVSGNAIVSGIGVGTTTIYSNSVNLNNSGTLRIGNAEFLAKAGNDLSIYQGKIRIQQGGNVGIGTTSPARKLEVYNGSSSLVSQFRSGSGTSSFICFANTGSTADQVRIGSISSNLVLSTNYTERMRIDSSGNVGIGTTSPSTPLHINADAPTIRLQDATSGDNHYFTGNNGELRVQTSGYMTMRPGNAVSTTFLANGNVGIGTSSPSEKLEVNGNASISGGIYVGGVNSFIWNNTANSNLRFGANGSEKMRIASSGNVGIGTTSPSQKLQVEGEGYSTGGWGVGTVSTPVGKIFNNSGVFAVRAETARNISFGNVTNGEFVRINPTGDVGIGTTSPSEKLHVQGNIRIQSDNTNGHFIQFRNNVGAKALLSNTYNISGGATSEDDFNTYVYGNNPYSIWTNNNNRFTVSGTGNVGIGTTSPDSLLEIASDSVTDFLKLTSTGGGSTPIKLIFEKSTSEQGIIEYNRNGDLEIYNTDVDGGVMIDGSASGGADLYVANTGNVGIGTTSPGHKLDVNGGAQFNTNTGATPFYITRLGGTDQALSIKVMDDNVRFESIQDETADSYGGFDFRMDGGTTEPNFVVRKNAGDPILHVDGGGNVGIGTTSPQKLLEVKSSTAYDSTLRLQTSAHSWDIQGGEAGYSSTAFALDYDGTTFFRALGITDNRFSGGLSVGTINATPPTGGLYVAGNVGIGTTSPGAKLDVLVGGTNHIQLGASALGSTGDYIGGLYYSSNKLLMESFLVGTGYQDILLSPNGGNVGIGTTSPGAKLDVNGSVNTAFGATNGYRINTNRVLSQVPGGVEIGVLDYKTTYPNISFNNDNTFRVQQNGSTRIIVNSSGNVGIGATSPGYKLDVSGDAYIDETLNIETTISGTLQYGYGGVGAGHLVVGGNNFASFTPAVITLMNQDTTISPGQDLGVLQFGGKDDLTNGYANGQIICTTAVGAGSGNTGGGIFRFLLSGNTTGSAPTERMRITNTGNVGIGTTSPAKKLTIGGIGIGNTDGLKIEDPSNTAYGAHYSYDDGSTTVEIGGVVNNTLIDCISIARDATRTITIDTSERVGIGDTTPSYKLDVTGEGRFTGDLRCLTLIQTSQRDQKENINDINKSKAKAIPFKEYTYKSSIDGSSKKRYGVIAEDIENDYPELVHTGADGIKGINYIDLLVKRVAELEKELEDISLTPGPKGDTGAAGANGADGSNGADGNSHLSNVTSIAFNPKANRLEVNIGGTVYNFVPSK